MKMNGKNSKRWTSMALAWLLLFSTPSLKAADGDIHVAMATEAGVIEQTISQPSATSEPVLVQDFQGDSQATPEATESPAPTLEATTAPAPTPEATEAPAPTQEATEAPTPTLEATEAPALTPEATEAPAPTLEATAAPAPTLEATEAPAPTLEATEAPTPTLEATEAPAPTQEATAAPAPTLEATEAPAPTLEATEAPAPTLEATAAFALEASISEATTKASAPVTLQMVKTEYTLDDAIQVELSPTLGAEYEISDLRLVAVHEGGQTEAFTEPVETSGVAELLLPKNAPAGSWTIEATCKVTTTSGTDIVDVTENFAGIAPVGFTVTSKEITLTSSGKYITGQVYNGGEPLRTQISFECKDSTTRLTEEDFKLSITRNGVAYTPAEEELNGLVFSPRLAGEYQAKIELADPSITGYFINRFFASSTIAIINRADAPYRVAVSQEELDPQGTLHVTVDFNSELAWSEMEGNGENAGEVHLTRNGIEVPWKTFTMSGLGQIELEGALPDSVGAGDWQIVVDIPIINHGEDRSDNYKTVEPATIKVRGTENFDLVAEATNGQYFSSKGSVTFTAAEDVTLEGIVGFEVTRNGEPLEPGEATSSSIVYQGNTATFTALYAGEYEIRPYAVQTEATYTFDCVGEVSIAKAPSPIELTLDQEVYASNADVVFTLSALPGKIAEWDLENARVSYQFPMGSGTFSYSTVAEKPQKTLISAPGSDGDFEVRASITGSNSAGIALNSLYEDAVASAHVSSKIIEIQTENNAKNHTYAQAAEGSAYVRFAAQPGASGGWVNAVELWIMNGVENAPFALSDTGAYGRIVRDSNAGTLIYFPKYVGEYAVQLQLKEGAEDYVLSSGADLQAVKISKASAPIVVSVDSARMYYPGEKAPVTLSKQRVYDEFSSVTVYALDVQGERHEIYQGTLDEPEVHTELNLSEDAASGEWTIYVDFAMEDGGFDFAGNYEDVASASIQVGQSFRLSAQAEDGAYAGAATAAYAEFSWDGGMPDGWQENVGLQVTRDGKSFSPNGANGRVELTDTGFRFVPMVSGEFEVTPVMVGEASYRLEAGTAPPAGIPAWAQATKNATYYPGDKMDIRLSVFDGVLGEGDEISKITVYNEAGTMLIGSIDTLEDQKEYLLHSFIDYQEPVGYVTYTIRLEISRDGVDVSECYAAIEPVGFIVRWGPGTPVVYLTAESQDGGFADTRNRGAYVLFHMQTPDPELSEKIELNILRDGVEFVPDGTNGVIEYGEDFLAFYPECVGVFTVQPVVKSGVDCELVASQAIVSVEKGAAAVKAEMKDTAYRPGDTLEVQLSQVYVPVDEVSAEIQVYAMDANNVRHEIGNVATDALPQALTLTLEEDAPEGSWLIHAQWSMSRDGVDVSEGYTTSASIPIQVEGKTTISLERTTVSGDICDALTGEAYVEYTSQSALPLEELVSLEVLRDGKEFEVRNGVNCALTYTENAVRFSPWHAGEYEIYLTLKEDVEGYALRAVGSSLSVRKGDPLFSVTTDRTQYQPDDTMTWTVELDRSMAAYVSFSDVYVGIEYGNAPEIIKESLEEAFLADPSMNAYSAEKILEETYGEGQKAIVVGYRAVTPSGEDISDSFEAAEPARFVIAAEGITMISLDALVTHGNYLDIGTANAPKVLFALPEALKDSGVPMDEIRLEITRDGKAYTPKDGAVVYGEDTVSFIPQTVGEYVITPKLEGADGFALLANPARLTVSKAPAPVTYSSEESVLPGGHFSVEYTVQEDKLAEGDAFDSIRIEPSYGSYANPAYESSELQGVVSFEVLGDEDVDSVKGLIEIRTTILRNGEDVSDCYETGYWPFAIEKGTLRLTLADSESLPCKYVARFEAEDLMDGYSIEHFVDLRVFRDGELVKADGVQMVCSSDDPTQYTLTLLWPGKYVIMPVLKDNVSYRDLAFAEGAVEATVPKAQNPVSRIEVEDSTFPFGGEVPVTVYLKDTLIDRGTGKDELISLTVWASSENGEMTQSVNVASVSDALESGEATVTLTLPEDGAALGAWTVYAQTQISFSSYGVTSDCYLESNASASFTVEEKEVTLGSETASGSYASPERLVRFYDEAGEFDMQNIELVIRRNDETFIPDEKNGVVKRTSDEVIFYPYCAGEFTVTPVLKEGLTGYRLNAQTCALSVTPSEPVVYVQPEYSAYRPGEAIRAYLYVEYGVLDDTKAYYGDELESVQIWAANGELRSDSIIIPASDIHADEPVSIELPQGAQPGMWEIIVQPTIRRDALYDTSDNYEVHSENFELLEAGQKIVRLERETDEIVGYWPLTLRYDVQISGENTLDLEDLIEIYIEGPEGPVEINGEDISVRYADTSIEMTINREGEFWVCAYLKTDGDEYVLLPEGEFLRDIWVEARQYEFPVEIFYAEEGHVPGEIVPITLYEGWELQSGHHVSELSIWATNGEQSTDVLNLNDVSLPQDVKLQLPEEATLGEWTIKAACKIVDSDGKDVTYQYESEQSGPPLSVGRQIRLEYYDSADGNYSQASSWGVAFATRDCQSQEELEELVELEITRYGDPFVPDGTNGRVTYDFMGQEGAIIFDAMVAGEFVVTPILKEGMEKDCYLVAEAQTVNVTRAEAALELQSDAGVYQPEDVLTVSLKNVRVASGFVISDDIQSVKVWATNGEQRLETQTFVTPLPETVVWTLPENVQLGEWTVQAEVQVVREGTQMDVSDCYEAVEPLRIQIVQKDIQILQLICDSAASGFAPGVVHYQANPMLTEDQLGQLVDMEITEDGRKIPIDGEKIALSYGDGEITVEFRRGGTFTLTPQLKDGVANTMLDVSAQTLTLTRQEAPVRAQIADAYQPGDAVQVSLELNEHCTAEIRAALQSFEVVLIAPDGTGIRQSVEGPFSAGAAIAPVLLQLPADAQPGTWTLEIRADMGLYGDCVENFVPVQFAVTEKSVQVIQLSADSQDGDYGQNNAWVTYTVTDESISLEGKVVLSVLKDGNVFDASNGTFVYAGNKMTFWPSAAGEYVVTPVKASGQGEDSVIVAEPVSFTVRKANAPLVMDVAEDECQVGEEITVKLSQAATVEGDAITDIQLFATNAENVVGPVKAEEALPQSVTLMLPYAGEWEITAKVYVEREVDGWDVTQNYETVVPVRVTCVDDEPLQTPTPTATAAPMATPTAAPTATVSPTEAPAFDLPYVEPQGNALYDSYLGTGGGLSELGIVYDETYGLDEYELLAVLYGEDQAEENVLLVVAQPDENGTYAQRSLVLSGLQLARLWQEKKIEWIQLRSGEASALLRIEELLSGDAAKFIAWALEDPDAAQLQALQNRPEVELKAEQLDGVRIEVRIAPDGDDGYRLGVYGWYADVQQEITALVPSFTVCLTAGEQGDETDRAEYAATHAVSATNEFGAVEFLKSALMETPPHETEDTNRQGEYFDVRIDAEENVVVLYDPEKPVHDYRCWSLCALWIGEAEYRLMELKAEQ